MRKYSLTLLVVLLAIALGLGAVACGSSKTASGLTPEEAVTAAMDAAQNAASQSGTYEIGVTIDADSADSDPMLQAFLGQPIVITGDFATQKDPVRADLTMGLSLMGMSVELGIRAIDDEAWLNMMGQWYVIPADQMEELDLGGSADLSASLLQMMSDKGIDPNSWLKDLTVVGKETVADTQTTHMTGSLDIQKMFTDVFTLTQDPEFLALMGDVAQSDSAISIPDATEIQDAQDMIEQLVQNATFDLWLADDSSLRKATANVDLSFPEEMGLPGVTGGNVLLTMNFNEPGQTIEVSAPASAKPIEQLQEDLASNPLLQGLGGLLGGGSGLDLSL